MRGFFKLISWFLGAILLLGIVMLMVMLGKNSPIYFMPQQPWIFWDAEAAKNLDLINLASGIGVLAAAIGLTSFSYLTYQRQDSQEFDDLFNTLLRQHNELLNQINLSELDKLNAKTIELYLFNRVNNPIVVENGIKLLSILTQWKMGVYQDKNFSDYLKKISHEITHEVELIDALNDAHRAIQNGKSAGENRVIKAEIAFSKLQAYLQPQNRLDDNPRYEKDIKTLIDANTSAKPYLITLYRLLKFVAQSNKIDKQEKNEYYGLIRAAIPPKVLFLILFNSKGWIKGQKGATYQDLMRKAKLLEHLPVSKDWLQELLANGYHNGDQKAILELADGVLEIGLQNYIFTESIHSDAFGKSTYHALWKVRR